MRLLVRWMALQMRLSDKSAFLCRGSGWCNAILPCILHTTSILLYPLLPAVTLVLALAAHSARVGQQSHANDAMCALQATHAATFTFPSVSHHVIDECCFSHVASHRADVTGTQVKAAQYLRLAEQMGRKSVGNSWYVFALVSDTSDGGLQLGR